MVEVVNDATPTESVALRSAQNEWRKRGAISKVPNIAIFIRCSPQRRETFGRRVVDGVDDGESPSMSPFVKEILFRRRQAFLKPQILLFNWLEYPVRDLGILPRSP